MALSPFGMFKEVGRSSNLVQLSRLRDPVLGVQPLVRLIGCTGYLSYDVELSKR